MPVVDGNSVCLPLQGFRLSANLDKGNVAFLGTIAGAGSITYLAQGNTSSQLSHYSVVFLQEHYKGESCITSHEDALICSMPCTLLLPSGVSKMAVRTPESMLELSQLSCICVAKHQVVDQLWRYIRMQVLTVKHLINSRRV